MRIKILGSGTILSNNRNPSGYLIECQKNRALIDCGPGILKRLIEINVDPSSFSAFFISHFHLDHYSDVLPILMRRYLKNRHINRKLTIFGPVGLKYWYETQSKLQGSWFSEYKPKLTEMHATDEVKWADWYIKSFPTQHIENSIAYKFVSRQESFFYSSDTDYDYALVNFARHSKIAILECSHSDQNPVKGHLTPRKAAKFINKAGIENTILTHIYPDNDTDDLLSRVKQYTERNVQIGHDLMEFEV